MQILGVIIGLILTVLFFPVVVIGFICGMFYLSFFTGLSHSEDFLIYVANGFKTSEKVREEEMQGLR